VRLAAADALAAVGPQALKSLISPAQRRRRPAAAPRRLLSSVGSNGRTPPRRGHIVQGSPSETRLAAVSVVRQMVARRARAGPPATAFRQSSRRSAARRGSFRRHRRRRVADACAWRWRRRPRRAPPRPGTPRRHEPPRAIKPSNSWRRSGKKTRHAPPGVQVLSRLTLWSPWSSIPRAQPGRPSEAVAKPAPTCCRRPRARRAGTGQGLVHEDVAVRAAPRHSKNHRHAPAKKRSISTATK